jgi:hypothetical protein
MRVRLLLTTMLLIVAHGAKAQSCPKWSPEGPEIDSAPQTLSGKIIFHNDLRQWFELRLDAPVCGENRVQLLADENHPSLERTIQTLRGCRVTAHGALGLPGTGYYSAELYQEVDKVAPNAGCLRQQPFPDYSKLRPSPALRNYRVLMWFDYTKPDSPVHGTVSDGKDTLRPWQQYASYELTGGFVFYASCADEFSVSDFNGTPEAKAWLADSRIALDPEAAAAKHADRIRLAFTCRREPARSAKKLSR